MVELALKNLFQKFISFVAWASAVAVDEKELPAFDGLDGRFAVQLNPQLVMQIAEAPEVVIADKHVYGNARIGELGQFTL